MSNNQPKFKTGQIVTTILGNRKVMIEEVNAPQGCTIISYLVSYWDNNGVLQSSPIVESCLKHSCEETLIVAQQPHLSEFGKAE